MRQIRDTRGPSALAGFGSAKGTNEEAYLFQKLVRTGFGTNNVDHCTRLCHASSVAALLEGVGSGAVSNQVTDVAQAEVVFVIGANPTVNHPVAATWMKNAVERGAKLIVADPRRNELARHAAHFLQFKPDTDVALLNAMIHTIVEEGLVDRGVRARSAPSNFEALKREREGLQPRGDGAGVRHPGRDHPRGRARLFATSKGSMILWGMGISQHVHGTDNARCLIALTLMTGQIGRPGTGLHPLRGQNNVQGASDAGLIPMMYPDYQRVDNPEAIARFEKFWGTRARPPAGPDRGRDHGRGACAGRIRGMYIMGENPAMSDPTSHHAREALAELEHLVVQDIFLTETAYLADVVLPASALPEKTGTFTNTDRIVQLGRQALELPGDARQDLWIIQEIGKRLGLDWNYTGPESAVAQVFDEMRQRDDLDRRHHLGAPRARVGASPIRAAPRAIRASRSCSPTSFPTEGRAREVRSGGHHPRRRAARRRVPDGADHRPPARALAHRQHDAPRRACSTRSSREPVASVHPLDLDALGARPGDVRHGRLAPRRDRALRARRRRHRRAARCSSRSPTTRRRRTCSPTRRSTRSARSPSSSTAP